MKPGIRQHGPATLKLSFNTSVPANMRGGLLEVTHVFTPEQHRNQGYASMLLQKVCAEADEAGKVLLLMPKPYDVVALEREQLVDWYSRFGFVPIQTEPTVIMARQAGSDIRVKMKPLTFAMAAGIH